MTWKPVISFLPFKRSMISKRPFLCIISYSCKAFIIIMGSAIFFLMFDNGRQVKHALTAISRALVSEMKYASLLSRLILPMYTHKFYFLQLQSFVKWNKILLLYLQFKLEIIILYILWFPAKLRLQRHMDRTEKRHCNNFKSDLILCACVLFQRRIHPGTIEGNLHAHVT